MLTKLSKTWVGEETSYNNISIIGIIMMSHGLIGVLNTTAIRDYFEVGLVGFGLLLFGLLISDRRKQWLERK